MGSSTSDDLLVGNTSEGQLSPYINPDPDPPDECDTRANGRLCTAGWSTCPLSSPAVPAREAGAVWNENAELGETGGDWGMAYRALNGRGTAVDANAVGCAGAGRGWLGVKLQRRGRVSIEVMSNESFKGEWGASGADLVGWALRDRATVTHWPLGVSARLPGGAALGALVGRQRREAGASCLPWPSIRQADVP